MALLGARRPGTHDGASAGVAAHLPIVGPPRVAVAALVVRATRIACLVCDHMIVSNHGPYYTLLAWWCAWIRRTIVVPVCRIMSCTADALAAMHEHVPNALLHRDVKADNVLLGDGLGCDIQGVRE